MASLRDEVLNDPLGRGYSTMTNAEVVIDLYTKYRLRPKSLMTGSEVMNATDKSEYNSLSDFYRELYWNILHLGELNPFGVEKDILVDIFGSGSLTIEALQNARQENISRVTELSLGVVKEGHVELVLNE